MPMEVPELLFIGPEMVTIPRGGTPVIFYQNGSVIPLAMAVNALRSDCPAVQLIFGDIHEVHFTADLQRVEQTIASLRLNGEHFSFETVSDKPYVVLLRRALADRPAPVV